MKKLGVILISVVFCAANIQAQDTLRLNLDQALELALSENPTIKIADKEIAMKRYAKKESWTNLVSLTASASFSHSFKKQVMFLEDNMFPGMPGGAMEIGFDNSLTAGLNATLSLVTPGVWKSIDMAQTDIELALESARSSKINLINEVKKAYYGAILTEESYNVLKQSMDVAIQNLDNVKLMFEQGMVAEYDLIRADVRVRNLQPSLVQMRTTAELSNMMLKVLLSVPEEVVLAVDGDFNSLEQDVLVDAIPMDFSLNNNTDLVQMELNLRKLEQQKTLVNTQRMPSLVAFGSVQPMSQANNLNFQNWASPVSAGLQLNVPLFDIFAKDRQSKQMRIGIEQLTMQKDYITSNLSVQAKNSVSKMLEAREQITSNKEGVRQAQKGLEISQTMYKTGAGTILELNDSEMALTQAKMNYNQSIYNYLVAKAEFEKLLGNEN